MGSNETSKTSGDFIEFLGPLATKRGNASSKRKINSPYLHFCQKKIVLHEKTSPTNMELQGRAEGSDNTIIVWKKYILSARM